MSLVGPQFEQFLTNSENGLAVHALSYAQKLAKLEIKKFISLGGLIPGCN